MQLLRQPETLPRAPTACWQAVRWQGKPLLHFVLPRAIALRVHLLVGHEFQRCAVDAVAQSAFVFRAVVEHVSQMGIGVAAAHFGAYHVVRRVFALGYGFAGDGAGKAGPAAT